MSLPVDLYSLPPPPPSSSTHSQLSSSPIISTSSSALTEIFSSSSSSSSSSFNTLMAAHSSSGTSPSSATSTHLSSLAAYSQCNIFNSPLIADPITTPRGTFASEPYHVAVPSLPSLLPVINRSEPIQPPSPLPTLHPASFWPSPQPLRRSFSASSESSTSSPMSPRSPLVMSPHLHPYAQSYASLASSSASSGPFTQGAITVEPPTAPPIESPTIRKRERDNDSEPSSSQSSADPDKEDDEDSRKASSAPKRRKVWVHALEKSFLTPEEIATLGAPVRRTMYTASLEANIDALHAQLLSIGYFPVPFKALNPYTGLNVRTARSMVAGLVRDTNAMRARLAEVKREETRRSVREEREREMNARVISDAVADMEGSQHEQDDSDNACEDSDAAIDIATTASAARSSYVYPGFEPVGLQLVPSHDIDS